MLLGKIIIIQCHWLLRGNTCSRTNLDYRADWVLLGRLTLTRMCGLISQNHLAEPVNTLPRRSIYFSSGLSRMLARKFQTCLPAVIVRLLSRTEIRYSRFAFFTNQQTYMNCYTGQQLRFSTFIQQILVLRMLESSFSDLELSQLPSRLSQPIFGHTEMKLVMFASKMSSLSQQQLRSKLIVLLGGPFFIKFSMFLRHYLSTFVCETLTVVKLVNQFSIYIRTSDSSLKLSLHLDKSMTRVDFLLGNRSRISLIAQERKPFSGYSSSGRKYWPDRSNTQCYPSINFCMCLLFAPRMAQFIRCSLLRLLMLSSLVSCCPSAQSISYVNVLVLPLITPTLTYESLAWNSPPSSFFTFFISMGARQSSIVFMSFMSIFLPSSPEFCSSLQQKVLPIIMTCFMWNLLVYPIFLLTNLRTDSSPWQVWRGFVNWKALNLQAFESELSSKFWCALWLRLLGNFLMNRYFS